ncbi:MAG: hypothetical protein C0601_03545 [Candidatus Muiribacterium halophilum]|uniref:Uncharacterized protein n=1 Tax=Muiribacterium halophilum TaxID=2053465 RepID=A0A2N5ZJI6_MUIH1|nr:MAG: hypothetical protein C0601_03545 [Candidatus Muirbacterium halophilum]
MKQFLNYRTLAYLSIAFFFIINILISFSFKPSDPVFYDAIKKYAKIINENNTVKSVLTKLTDSRDFKQALMKPGEISRDITGLKNSRITIETNRFDESDDTYGFINIYIESHKFTYPFKKVDISTFINEHTFYVNQSVRNTEILNTGGTLSLSCINKIHIPSIKPLVYNLYFEDVFLLPGDYLFNNLKKEQTFYSGFDYYGFFSILKKGKTEIYPSRFRLRDISEENIDNIDAELAFRYIKWEKDDSNITPLSIEENPISGISKQEMKRSPDLDTMIKKATVIINRDYYIPNYSTYLYGKGLYLFKDLTIESSSQPLIINGKLSLVGAEGLKIKRDINLEGDLSISNFISLSTNKRNDLLSASKIDGYFAFEQTPKVLGNLTINGNMFLEIFDKKNILGNLSISPRIIPRDNDIVSISPIVNFLQGGISK